MKNNNLHSLFEELGFNNKERDIYEALLRIGPSASSVVAKEVNLPRQTVYSVITKLVEEGFIEEGIWKGVKKFVADPEALISALDLRTKKAEKLKQKVEEMLPILTSLSKTHRAMPKITYYEGEHGLKRLFDSILNQYEKGADKIFRGFGINYLGRTGIKEILYDFVKERYEKYKVETHLLVAEGEDDFGIDDGLGKLGRNVKHIKMDPQNSAVYLVGGKIYLFSYDDEIGIMIDNSSMTSMLVSIFDAYWNSVKEQD